MLIPITPINSKGAIPVYWLKCICRCQTRVLPVRNYTVAKVDSTGFVVRIGTQCSAGKA